MKSYQGHAHSNFIGIDTRIKNCRKVFSKYYFQKAQLSFFLRGLCNLQTDGGGN